MLFITLAGIVRYSVAFRLKARSYNDTVTYIRFYICTHMYVHVKDIRLEMQATLEVQKCLEYYHVHVYV